MNNRPHRARMDPKDIEVDYDRAVAYNHPPMWIARAYCRGKLFVSATGFSLEEVTKNINAAIKAYNEQADLPS